MSRRRYVHLAGDLSGYPKGMVPEPAWGRRLDQFSSELVNGDEGGTWAPETPIVIGPRSTPTITIGNGSLLSGDIETVRGNSAGTDIDAIPGLVLSGSAVPTFQSTRSRTVVVGFANFTEYDSLSATNIPRVLVDPLTLGAKLYSSLTSSRIISAPFPLRAQHRGGTITNVAFRFIVAGGALWTALPGTMLRVRVARIRADVVAALHTTTGVYDANGYYEDDAATVAAFVNNGQVRTINYVPNQNNGPIDPDQDWYVLQIRPFTGTQGLGSIIVSATVTITGIAGLRE